MIKRLKNNEESGRSMVEMLGVLAIVGILSIGGINGFSKAMDRYKLNKTLNQITMIFTNIHTTFGNQHSYAKLNNETAITYEIAGNDLSHGTSDTLTNAYNGSVTIQAIETETSTTECTISGDDDGSTYCPFFKVTYTHFPQKACAEIASSDWGETPSSDLISITVNNTLFTWSGQNKIPVSFSAADTACSKNDDTNTITWIYK